jgi:7-cyano-7-deazaguanine reductase
MSFSYQQTELGKTTLYDAEYSPSILCPLPRLQGRQALNIATTALPFEGVDVWHNYEASWLNAKGKPQVAIVQLIIPCTSPYLIESKSLKLYFNSLNFKKFDSKDDYQHLVHRDLSAALGSSLSLRLLPVEFSYELKKLDGVFLDDLDIECRDYTLDANLLRPASPSITVTETVYSHLLRSNCPVTNQPDWGSVQISYTGAAIEHRSILQYLISFRQHNDFHEQCVERIFMDIMNNFSPKALTVQAFYTRRGGLDINPFRSNSQAFRLFERVARQ